MFFMPRNIGLEHAVIGACAIVLSSIIGTLINNKIFNQSTTNKKHDESKEK